MVHLSWDFDGSGLWQASSCVYADDCSLQWVIVVCDDGTFDVNDSDSELLVSRRKQDCFPTLAAAKAWCVSREEDAIASMEPEPIKPEDHP